MTWKSAVAVALFVLTAGSASATTWYVSNSGSDANAGTLAAPFATISKGAAVAKAGDVVDVRGGVYGKTSIGSVGTSAAHITIQSYPGELAVIDGTGTASGTDIVTLASAAYVDFLGFEVRNATKIGITLWQSSNIRIANCNIHHNTRNGIYAGASSTGLSSNITADGNDVHDNVLENQYNTMTGGGWASALTIDLTSGGTITNNKVHNNHGEGIDAIRSSNWTMRGNTAWDNFSVNLYVDNGSFGTIDRNFVYTTGDSSFYRSGYPASGIQVANETYSTGMQTSSNDTITNNIVIGGRWGFYYGSYGAGGGLKNFTIANNTFYKAAQTMLSIDSDAHSGTVIENNIFDQVGNVMTYVPSTSGLTFRSNNWYGGNAGTAAGAGDVLANPQLSNPNGLTAADYKLTSSTPLVGAGLALSTVANDYWGNVRTINDIGAHELSGSTTSNTADTTAPTSSITAPANGSTVSGTVNVTVSASDNVGVARVEFYLDGALQATSSVAPYAWSWNTAGASGRYTLTARAFDAAGNGGTSAGVGVTIAAADTAAPTAPANLTATSPGKRKIALSWQASTDNVGVTGYRIFRSTSATGPFTQVATTTATSYTNSTSSRTTYWYYVTAVDAAGNVSAASNTVSLQSR